MSTIFTKIISGDIPSYKLYEDENIFAFLDINPIQKGHTLVVPKIEIDSFIDVPEPYYSAVFSVSKNLARAIQITTKCARVGTTVLGWDVPHFHYHLVPMNQNGDLNFNLATKLPHEQMIQIQQDIISQLKNKA